MPETYWLDLCTVETWEKFRQAGGKHAGFRDDRWETAQRINCGDYLLSYLIGVSRWIGQLEVTGEASRAQPPRWEGDAFPVRLPVKSCETSRQGPHRPHAEDRRSNQGNERAPVYFSGSRKSQRLDRQATPSTYKVDPVGWTGRRCTLEQAQAHPVERPFGRT
jgi:hypothetical protein